MGFQKFGQPLVDALQAHGLEKLQAAVHIEDILAEELPGFLQQFRAFPAAPIRPVIPQKARLAAGGDDLAQRDVDLFLRGIQSLELGKQDLQEGVDARLHHALGLRGGKVLRTEQPSVVFGVELAVHDDAFLAGRNEVFQKSEYHLVFVFALDHFHFFGADVLGIDPLQRDLG